MFDYSKSGNLSFKYTYYANNQIYTGSSSYSGYGSGFGELFVLKRLPVVYAKTDPENSRMLLDYTDFAEFGIPFPDSLAWVLEHKH